MLCRSAQNMNLPKDLARFFKGGPRCVCMSAWGGRLTLSFVKSVFSYTCTLGNGLSCRHRLRANRFEDRELPCGFF